MDLSLKGTAHFWYEKKQNTDDYSNSTIVNIGDNFEHSVP